jgi:hypothetical protein
MIRRLLLLAGVFIVLFLLASDTSGMAPFQCGGEWKNEDGGYYEGDRVIASVWVKAGQGCYELPHVCYEVVSGGVGYTYVEVIDAGGSGCQDISHLEGAFAEVSITPTVIYTATVAPTETPEETHTPTPYVPEVTETATEAHMTPTSTPFSGTPTPWPTRECTNPGGCGGTG